MKKLVLGVVAAAVMGFAGSASAAPVCAPLACVTANEGGYVAVVDGDAGNPDPIDGFASVSEGGQVCADDNGTADDGDPENGAESASPTCAP